MSNRLQHRIEKLEQRLFALRSEPIIAMRLIVSGYAGSLNLEKSTYQLVPGGAGSLIELIRVDGSTDEDTEKAELEAWIARQAAKAEKDRRVQQRNHDRQNQS